MAIVDTADQSPGKIYTPWDVPTVTALNRYQREGQFHPFTCGNGQSGQHVGGVSLIATPDGWRCPMGHCDYTQNWAWSFMAVGNHSER